MNFASASSDMSSPKHCRNGLSKSESVQERPHKRWQASNPYVPSFTIPQHFKHMEHTLDDFPGTSTNRPWQLAKKSKVPKNRAMTC